MGYLKICSGIIGIGLQKQDYSLLHYFFILCQTGKDILKTI